MEKIDRFELSPFMAVLNMIKANYLENEEIFKALLAMLVDYSVEDKEKIAHYIKVLLSQNLDLADCLLTFLPENESTNFLPVPDPRKVISHINAYYSAGEEDGNEEEDFECNDDSLHSKNTVSLPQNTKIQGNLRISKKSSCSFFTKGKLSKFKKPNLKYFEGHRTYLYPYQRKKIKTIFPSALSSIKNKNPKNKQNGCKNVEKPDKEEPKTLDTYAEKEESPVDKEKASPVSSKKDQIMEESLDMSIDVLDLKDLKPNIKTILSPVNPDNENCPKASTSLIENVDPKLTNPGKKGNREMAPAVPSLKTEEVVRKKLKRKLLKPKHVTNSHVVPLLKSKENVNIKEELLGNCPHENNGSKPGSLVEELLPLENPALVKKCKKKKNKMKTLPFLNQRRFQTAMENVMNPFHASGKEKGKKLSPSLCNIKPATTPVCTVIPSLNVKTSVMPDETCPEVHTSFLPTTTNQLLAQTQFAGISFQPTLSFPLQPRTPCPWPLSVSPNFREQSLPFTVGHFLPQVYTSPFECFVQNLSGSPFPSQKGQNLDTNLHSDIKSCVPKPENKGNGEDKQDSNDDERFEDFGLPPMLDIPVNTKCIVPPSNFSPIDTCSYKPAPTSENVKKSSYPFNRNTDTPFISSKVSSCKKASEINTLNSVTFSAGLRPECTLVPGKFVSGSSSVAKSVHSSVGYLSQPVSTTQKTRKGYFMQEFVSNTFSQTGTVPSIRKSYSDVQHNLSSVPSVGSSQSESNLTGSKAPPAPVKESMDCRQKNVVYDLVNPSFKVTTATNRLKSVSTTLSPNIYLGTSSNLSSFPYKRQMILKDGQTKNFFIQKRPPSAKSSIQLPSSISSNLPPIHTFLKTSKTSHTPAISSSNENTLPMDMGGSALTPSSDHRISSQTETLPSAHNDDQTKTCSVNMTTQYNSKAELISSKSDNLPKLEITGNKSQTNHQLQSPANPPLWKGENSAVQPCGPVINMQAQLFALTKGIGASYPFSGCFPFGYNYTNPNALPPKITKSHSYHVSEGNLCYSIPFESSLMEQKSSTQMCPVSANTYASACATRQSYSEPQMSVSVGSVPCSTGGRQINRPSSSNIMSDPPAKKHLGFDHENNKDTNC